MGATMDEHDSQSARGPSAPQPRDPDPALRDDIANATYEYDEALMDYQTALVSADGDKRTAAEARLHDATQRLAAAQAALVDMRRRTQPRPVSFDELLGDSTQQLDPAGLVMASVLAYRSASHATASASPSWVDHAPPPSKTGLYVHQRVRASTVVATAS
jgi:hypothetical protein